MTLTAVLVLFLIAAIIFLLDAVAAFAVTSWAYTSRAHSLAFGLMAVAFLLWHGGK